MNRRQVLGAPERINALAEKLRKYHAISRFDDRENIEAGSIAHAFSDLEESFLKLLEEHFPRLADTALTEAEMRGLLQEIGEEFRHILYHISDLKSFSYLVADHETKSR